MTPASHPGTSDLLAYLEGALSDADGESIELHLAQCDACAQISQRCFAATQAIGMWNAAAHGQDQHRGTLSQALAQAEEASTNPEWRGRLRRWRERWAGTAEAALRTVLQGSAVLAAGMDALTRPGSTWSFLPEPAMEGTWGEADDTDHNILLTSSATLGQEPRARVEIRATTGDIVVRIDNLPMGPSPLVVLIAVKPDRQVVVQVAEIKRQAGSGGMVRFSKAPPGEYLVAFEPLADKPGSGS